MYEEDDLLPISGLQHLLFCERRAALVHTEGLWNENIFTTEGGLMHERVHEVETEVRGDTRIVRGLRLRSLRLGLSGKADMVEFHRVAEESASRGVRLEGVPGLWRPVPIEYKRGRLRHEEGYEIQTCAQAMCLEEMLGVEIPSGAIYYGETKRRLQIAFDMNLRKATESAATRLHELLKSDATPKAEFGPKCERCSLVNLCLPKATGGQTSIETYLAKAIAEGDEI